MRIKKYGLIFISCVASVIVHASHLRSGEIFYSRDSVNHMKFHALINFYTPVNAAIYNDSIVISWGDTTTYAYILNSTFLSSNSYKNTYTASHTYSSIPTGGVYSISTFEQNRFNGISNIDGGNSINIPLYLEAVINLQEQSLLTTNHSPTLDNLPAFYANFDLPYQVNPNLKDLDGDSLIAEAVVPLQDSNLQVPVYLFPGQYCFSQGFPGITFSVDNKTGEIEWSQVCLGGIFSIALRISEFRNGNFLGSVMRDQYIFVIDSPTSITAPIKEELSITLSPNPTPSALTCTLANPSPAANLQILSIEGKTLMQNLPVTQARTEIDVSGLPAGLYFLVLQDERLRVVRRFVKNP